MKTRDQLITFNVHRLALPVIRRFVKPAIIPYRLQELEGLPSGSFGNDLYHFLMRHNFQLLPHFETHDARHVLLGYGTDGVEEACMQYFYLGNRHYSVATLITGISSLILMPQHIGQFIRAYQRGRRSRRIGHLRLEYLMLHTTLELQATFAIPQRDKH